MHHKKTIDLDLIQNFELKKNLKNEERSFCSSPNQPQKTGCLKDKKDNPK